MHFVPRFLSRRTSKQTPKLRRQNAVRNFVYEATPYPSPSISVDVVSHYSYRIDGNDCELDRICRGLGFSGPDDFAIPVESWQARNFRWCCSNELVVTRTEDMGVDQLVECSSSIGVELSVKCFDGGVRVSEEGFTSTGIKGEESEVLTSVEDNVTSSISGGIRVNEEACDSIGVKDVISEVVLYNSEESVTGFRVNKEACMSFGIKGKKCELSNGVEEECVGVGGGRGGNGNVNGINGVRPCQLTVPPPFGLGLPVDDSSCSAWDMFRTFAPDENTALSNVNWEGFGVSDDDEGSDSEGVRRVGETAELFETCSLNTTSSDDDSSSTSSELTSIISPNGTFRRCITFWEKGELLGRGSFGSVYEGIADGGFFIAVKEVSLLDQGDLGRQSVYQLEQEIALLSQFAHENIVQYYGTDKDESKLYIFLELMTKGSLLSLYQKYHLRDSQVSAYTRQILHGLKYLHDRNVVHRDIKCANILVDASGSVKLADFGLAKAAKFNDVKSCKGTAFWMAPEVVNQKNQGYGLAADIWSLGCTVLEMLTRRLPYHSLECMPALFRIGSGIPPPVPESLSRDAREFILQCLQVNPNDRPTAVQLLDHPFVKRPI